MGGTQRLAGHTAMVIDLRHALHWMGRHDEPLALKPDDCRSVPGPESGGLLDVADLPTLRRVQRMPIEVNGQCVVLFCAGETVVAVPNRCPHAGSSLQSGTLKGNTLQCPAHRYQFDVRTGEVASRRFTTASGTPDTLPLRTIPTEIIGERVFLRIPELRVS